jgi:hypothetical protein
LAPNNPRNFKGKFGDATFRDGVRSGEATLREYAAYLLDRNGFSGVPPTQLAKITSDVFACKDSQVSR